MGSTRAAQVWGGPSYPSRDAGLPNMGASALGPRPITPDDVDQILRCEDAAALAEMSAYARSYFAIGGSVIMGVATTVASGLLGRRSIAAGAAIGTGLAAGVVMEARRRARQWQAVIEARLASLAAQA
ncbi:hypothetical protein [Demequina sp. NBRC 110053]|uniref:hypothetical protein n=1 Tax=Demequina sp. NBRC 110053 TaxID=1570342 RepID=UPI000A00AF62|nr:hypothetical protein [Demequina sp. NBRC 110053]